MGGCVQRDPKDVHTIVVDGVRRDSLHGAHIDVIADRIEAGSFAIAAAITGGDLFLDGARDSTTWRPSSTALRQTGVEVAPKQAACASAATAVPRARHQRPRSTQAFRPTCRRRSRSRWSKPTESARSTSTCTRTASTTRRAAAHGRQHPRVRRAHGGRFHGPSPLQGAGVEIPDLRAGATLVLAALAAEGDSRIMGIEHVARGYEDMVGKLSQVGARITEGALVRRRRSSLEALPCRSKTGPQPTAWSSSCLRNLGPYENNIFIVSDEGISARPTCSTAATSPSRSPRPRTV